MPRVVWMLTAVGLAREVSAAILGDLLISRQFGLQMRMSRQQTCVYFVPVTLRLAGLCSSPRGRESCTMRHVFSTSMRWSAEH